MEDLFLLLRARNLARDKVSGMDGAVKNLILRFMASNLNDAKAVPFALKSFVYRGKEPGSLPVTGIYIDTENKVAVATDRRSMLVDPNTFDALNDGKTTIVSVDGKTEIEGKFPPYRSIIADKQFAVPLELLPLAEMQYEYKRAAVWKAVYKDNCLIKIADDGERRAFIRTFNFPRLLACGLDGWNFSAGRVDSDGNVVGMIYQYREDGCYVVLSTAKKV